MPVELSDLKVFVEHGTYGLKKFESLLSDDRYMTVPEALMQTFGVLVSPSLQVPPEENAAPVVTPPQQLDAELVRLLQGCERVFVQTTGEASCGPGSQNCHNRNRARNL